MTQTLPQEIKTELVWISKASKNDLKKQEPRLDALLNSLTDNFKSDEMHDLKIALYSFHMYCEQLKISNGLFKLLNRFSVNRKAKDILKNTKKILAS